MLSYEIYLWWKHMNVVRHDGIFSWQRIRGIQFLMDFSEKRLCLTWSILQSSEFYDDTKLQNNVYIS